MKWGHLGTGMRRYKAAALPSLPGLKNETNKSPLTNNSWHANNLRAFIVGKGQVQSEPEPTPPPYLANLALWWDATDTDTITLVGSDVDSWTSKGYLTPTLTAANADRRPAYITDGGQGSDKEAVLFRYNATSSLRNNLFVRGSAYSINEPEYTVFTAGMHRGSTPSTYYGQNTPFAMHNANSTNIYATNVTQFNDRSLVRYIPQTTGSTTGRNITLTMQSLFTGAIAGSSPYFRSSYALDWNNLQPTYEQDIRFIGGKSQYTVSTTLSAYTQSYIPINDSFGMYGWQYGSGFVSVGLSNDMEQYEVLVYDYKLNDTEIQAVNNYLNTKWNLTFDPSSYAKVEYNFEGLTGLTNLSSQWLEFNDQGGTSTGGIFNFEQTNSYFYLNPSTTYDLTINSNDPVIPYVFDFWLKDSGGNYILNETDYYYGKGPVSVQLSAGTYSFSGRPVYDYVPMDSDAAAFLADLITTGGTADATISAATNTLFTELKNTGIYSKLLAFYPMLGGTRYSTGLNGNRTNSAYDIDWYNQINIIFDASGATGNGIGTGGNTKLLPTNFTQGNRHMSFYSNGDRGVTTAGYELGGGNGADNMIAVSYGATTGYFAFGSYKTYANTDTTGFYYTQLSGASSPYDMVGYKNGTQVINTTSSDSYNPTIYMSVLCDNRATAPSFNRLESSDKRCAWASYGDALTPTEISDFENIINTFQTTLNRNTY